MGIMGCSLLNLKVAIAKYLIKRPINVIKNITIKIKEVNWVSKRGRYLEQPRAIKSNDCSYEIHFNKPKSHRFNNLTGSNRMSTEKNPYDEINDILAGEINYKLIRARLEVDRLTNNYGNRRMTADLDMMIDSTISPATEEQYFRDF
jgi:hypothetical protein